MSDIFLSYASNDRARIEPLVKALEDQGWTVWWDIDLLEGERFRPTIRAALKGARCVVVAWSELSAASDWVLDEADVARKAGKLIPVRLGTEEDIPLGFGGIHTRDFSKWNGDTNAPEFLRLCAALQAKLNGPAQPVPPVSPPEASTPKIDVVAPPPRPTTATDPRTRFVALAVAAFVFVAAGLGFWWFYWAADIDYRVSVKFAGISRADMKKMTENLRTQGWKVQGEGASEGGEERAEAAGKNEIRYRDDVRAAALLVELVQAQNVTPASIALKKDASIGADVLELWLSKAGKETASTPSGQSTPFEAQAAGLMRQLITDFGFTDFQAAGILGNIGHETGGLRLIQEVTPVAGRGGLGYLLWTGPKRTSFEAFCQAKGLPPTSPEANYGFLKQELETTEKGSVAVVKATTTLEEATTTFQNRVVRAGIPNNDSRIKWARRAMEIFQTSQPVPATTKTAVTNGYTVFLHTKRKQSDIDALTRALREAGYKVGNPDSQLDNDGGRVSPPRSGVDFSAADPESKQLQAAAAAAKIAREVLGVDLSPRPQTGMSSGNLGIWLP